jgi:hypothetical protein
MQTPRTDLSRESEVQWKITWFPPDRSDVVRTGSEVQIRKQAQLQAEWNPIVESREITVGPWQIVDLDAPQEERGIPCAKHRAKGVNDGCPDCDHEEPTPVKPWDDPDYAPPGDM